MSSSFFLLPSSFFLLHSSFFLPSSSPSFSLRYGAETLGMSCGPTSGWDHDKGCAVGFGGFKGMEMSSATGPFEGMQIYMDDGTRFVAGLAATPLIQYYDGTSKSNTISI